MLSEDVSDTKLMHTNYSIFWLNRNKNTSFCSRRNDTLIDVNNSTTFFFTISVNTINGAIFVLLRFKNQSFIIGSIYIPPNVDKSNYDLYNNPLTITSEVPILF